MRSASETFQSKFDFVFRVRIRFGPPRTFQRGARGSTWIAAERPCGMSANQWFVMAEKRGREHRHRPIVSSIAKRDRSIARESTPLGAQHRSPAIGGSKVRLGHRKQPIELRRDVPQ